MTERHDYIHGEQDLQTAKLEGDAETLVNNIHSETEAHYVPEDSQNDVLQTLLCHLGEHPKYVNKSGNDRPQKQNHDQKTFGSDNENPCS